MDITVEFVQPFFSVVVGGDEAFCGEGVEGGEFVGFKGLVYFVPGFLIGSKDVGNLQSCQVECFTGRGAGDGMLQKFSGQGGKGEVFVSGGD